jgi:type II secretory pathway component PulF
MANWAYTVLDPSGQRRSGFVEANSREAAAAVVTAQGGFVLDLAERSAKSGFSQQAALDKKSRGKPNRAELALFTRRLADLSGAGLPLDRVLQIIAEQSESQVLADTVEDCLDDVRAGSSLSDSLAKHPKLFAEVFTSTLAAGEASGQLPEVSTKLAEFQEKEMARRSDVTSALVYPSVLFFATLGVVGFLLGFVIPKLAPTFNAMGDKVPVTTKSLIAAGEFIGNKWYLLIGAILALIVGLRWWGGTESGAYTRDSILLRLPVAGKVIMKATVSRFARILGTLVFGGVPILDALHLAGLASGNRVFKVSADEVRDMVRDGKGIAESMRDSGAFPPVITHMTAVGEETGDLPTMLGRVAESLDFEVETGLKRAVSLIEPAIVVVMGTFVGYVVISIMLPILQAQEAVK